MSRYVVVRVDDERVTRLWVEHYGGSPDDGSAWPDRIAEEAVPVPPDDQMVRDVATITDYFLRREPMPPEVQRLRAAFGLGEGGDDA